MVRQLHSRFGGCWRPAVAVLMATVWVGSLPAAADGPANPYLTITERNAFGIKPPTPPPEPPPVAPPTPPSNIFLTGISGLHGVNKAYLVVNKPASKTSDYLVVDNKYDLDGIKVIAIDPKAKTVKLVNGTVEQTLNFKDNSPKGPGGGAFPPPMGGPPGMHRPMPQPPGAMGMRGPGGEDHGGPTIIGRRRGYQTPGGEGVTAGTGGLGNGFDSGFNGGAGNGFAGGLNGGGGGNGVYLPSPVGGVAEPASYLAAATDAATASGVTGNNYTPPGDKLQGGNVIQGVPGQLANPTAGGRPAPPAPPPLH